MILAIDEGERIPIRLVKENGDTISLDATSIDMVVERQQSNFAIPFFGARKMAIDLNQAVVAFEVQGIFADDEGQEETAAAVATIDLYQPQQILDSGPIGGGGGGNGSGGIMGPTGSNFNNDPSNMGLDTGVHGSFGGGGHNPGGFGGGLGGPPVYDVSMLGNRIIEDWHKKFIDLPVGYWVETAAVLDNPVKTNLQLWLKADAQFPVNQWNDKHAITIGDSAPGNGGAWTDFSGNGRNAAQTSAGSMPRWMMSGPGGQPSIKFDGNNDFLEVVIGGVAGAYSPFLTGSTADNAEEITIITVSGDYGGTGQDTIISSREAGVLDKGFHISYEASDKIRAGWGKGSGTGAGGYRDVDQNGNHKANIHVMQFRDTSGPVDGQADVIDQRVNGDNSDTGHALGGYEVANGGITIGRSARTNSDYLKGAISEVLIYNRLLTIDEIHKVEGYLGRKYGVNLPAPHPYRGIQYAYEFKCITIGFDKERVGSKREPYGYLNRPRNTGLTVTGVTGANDETIALSGDPREWFEITQSSRPYQILFRDPVTKTYRGYSHNPQIATIEAATSNTLTVFYDIDSSLTGAVPQTNDEVFISPDWITGNLFPSGQYPTIVIPIKNADTFWEYADPEKSIGPEFPNFEDGTARTAIHGTDITRTDEFLAFLLENALTSPDISVGEKAVDLDGSTTMDKVFSVQRTESATGNNSRLIITQKYKTSLGQLKDVIHTNLGLGQAPVIEGFSGGKAGKKVMSAGDKVQDILGILANSNNAEAVADVRNSVDEVFRDVVDLVTQTIYSGAARGDFIKAIQIPYNSTITKGLSVFDTDVAQRNLFITNSGTGTMNKLSEVNTLHASQVFNYGARGHNKNGITGIVTDFNVHRDAEERAYVFSIKFMAADIIL